MKIIKYLFVISLINFGLIVGVVFAADYMKQSTETLISPAPNSSVTATVTPTAVVVNVKPKVTMYPTSFPTVDPLAGKCIIVISGTRYDMTDFRNLHSGGDIFQCGSDMTAIFNDRHPASYLNRIARYKI